MPYQIPTEAEVQGYFESMSNWGRWGADDELGAINLITPEKVRNAVGLVRTGERISCSYRLGDANPVPGQPGFMKLMMYSGEGWSSGVARAELVGDIQAAGDWFGMPIHGSHTHLDASSHVFRNGRMYNGRSSEAVTTQEGAKHGSVDLVHKGIVSRGVLFDFPRLWGKDYLEPGEAIHRSDLEAAEREIGVTVSAGDIVLIRVGRWSRPGAGKGFTQEALDVTPEGAVHHARHPGLHASAMPWLRERDLSVLGCDEISDFTPSGYSTALPIHEFCHVALGVWILDLANLDRLAERCASERRWEFLMLLAPLRIPNGTGSPINPIAVL